MVEVIGRQLDRCDVCGKKVHKIDLVRTNVDFLGAGGSNYIHNSTYTTDSWTVDTAVDAGLISSGPFCDRSRVSTDDGNTSTEILGSQTWTGSGTIRTTYGTDVSSWTSFVFAADLGPYQRETSPSTTFSLGLCDSDGSNKEELKSWTTSGSARAWVAVNVTDIPAGKSASALYFYISAVAVGKKWWVDRVQLIKNATALQGHAFVPSTGTDVYRSDTRMMTVRKVCSSCKEPLLSRTEQYNKNPEQRSDAPIAVDIQEI